MQVLVLGASRASMTLIKRLVSLDHDVVFVDPEASRIIEKKNLDVVAVDGVIIDVDVMREAGVEMADALCAVSESENQNLMAAQIARAIFNVKYVIARVYETDNFSLFDDSGFVTLSSPVLTVDAIIRELEDSGDEKKVGFCEHNILGNHIQFKLIEAPVDIIGSKVRELEDTDGRHVFGVIRFGHLKMAMPGMRIEKGDKLVLAIKV